MQIDEEIENKQIAKQYKELLKISYLQLSTEDKKLIRLAFNTAVDAHKSQRRKSGEAYIFHPIAVAKIVASEIGLDATSIAAALLHDTVEDTKYTLDDIERLWKYCSKNCAWINKNIPSQKRYGCLFTGREFP